MAEPAYKPFAAGRPVRKGKQANCKKCKQPCAQGELRIGKVVPSPFGNEGGFMKQWHHVNCMWEVFSKQRATTRKIEDPEEDIEGWEELSDEDKKVITDYLASVSNSPKKTPAKKTPKKDAKADPKQATLRPTPTPEPKKEIPSTPPAKAHPDTLFKSFRKICADIAEFSNYTDKTEVVRKLFTKGMDGSGFKGDLVLWVQMLLPMVEKRVYTIQSKQLIKIFSSLFNESQEEMQEHLNLGDVAETIGHFFELTKDRAGCRVQPAKKSTLTLAEVDGLLLELTKLSKEAMKEDHLSRIAKKCTANDLKMVIRLIKHDLRINAGPRHILEGVHPDAYAAYQSSRDLAAVVNQVISKTKGGKHSETGEEKASTSSALTVGIKLMTPVLPMLAESCTSVEKAMKKCPSGMFCDIKYDGERVQVHKEGNEFKYFSRSLKPVLPHKIIHFKDYIPKAFPSGDNLILDSEVLLVDTNTGKPLPFGTLGKHKQTAFQDATVCLFVFDCIYYNGDDLTNKPLKERRKILESVMVEIPNHVHFSEMKEINKADDLTAMIEKVIRMGLEGLVLKSLTGIYEPGKRHWLKVKKDYLCGGAMADSADLVVLGAWYGTGQKGGMMSVFLMGCYDPASRKWKSVTKVHTGHDDKTLERLQTELQMDKIDKVPSKIPTWLDVNKTMYPDFVAKDPFASPVWEISGAEFTQNQVHTADGISVRFPRVKRIRDDKTADHATSLPELKAIFKKSKETANFSIPRTLGSPLKAESSKSPTKQAVKNEPGTSRRSPTPDLEDGKSEPQSPDEQSDQEMSDRDTPEKPIIESESPKTRRGDTPKGQKRRNDSPGKESPSKRRGGTLNNKKTSGKSEKKTPIKLHRNLNGPQKPLPDVFLGIRVCLPNSLSQEDCDTLRRYFVAYGGKILHDKDADLATHVLYDSNTKTKSKGKKDCLLVNLNWLWTSIKIQKLLEVDKFTMKVE